MTASRILNRERKKCQHSVFSWTCSWGLGKLGISSVHYHATMAAIADDDDGDDDG